MIKFKKLFNSQKGNVNIVFMILLAIAIIIVVQFYGAINGASVGGNLTIPNALTLLSNSGYNVWATGGLTTGQVAVANSSTTLAGSNKLTYSDSGTGTLSTGTFDGNLVGNADTATSALSSTFADTATISTNSTYSTTSGTATNVSGSGSVQASSGNFTTLNAPTWQTTNLKLYELDANTLSLENLAGGTYKNLQLGNIVLKQIPYTSEVTATVNVAAGNLNGNYYYRITFVNPNGETDGGTASAVVSPANQKVNLTNIPVSADPTVTARKIYRTAAAASDSILAQYVATLNASDTTYTDNLADGGLGAYIPYKNTTGGIIYQNSGIAFNLGNGSTMLGVDAMTNGGYSSTAIGTYALAANTIGSRNTAVGMFALYSNTVGINNTATGVHSLNYNVGGSNNAAFGYTALMDNVSGNANSAFGVGALPRKLSFK
jgi:hypothetical protein